MDHSELGPSALPVQCKYLFPTLLSSVLEKPLNSHHSEETIPTPKTFDGKAKFVEATLDPNQLSLNRISKIIAAWKQQNKMLFPHLCDVLEIPFPAAWIQRGE